MAEVVRSVADPLRRCVLSVSEHRFRISRRNFITGAAGAAASASFLTNLAPRVADAAQSRKGSLDRIEPIVILMQENRAFDHYFGTMRGVRGFGDRAALRMHNGQDIFHQLDPKRADGGFLLTRRMDTSKVDGRDVGDTPHGWNDTHAAWNNGLWNSWAPFKTELSMSYYGPSDIPFQRALAQVFRLRQLLLLSPGTDHAKSRLPVDRYVRPARPARRSARRQSGRLQSGLQLDDVSRATPERRHRLAGVRQ